MGAADGQHRGERRLRADDHRAVHCWISRRTTNDIVHVEDGGWVFADGDFGSPSFINWNWPPSYTDGSGNNVVDPSIGTSDKGDNWRVIIATENRVKTAQQISGITPNIDQVRDPGSFSGTPNAVELGWHYYLAGLDSGFVYYGCNGDECLRAIVAQSNACRNVDAVIAANPAADTTPPTVFLPQRSSVESRRHEFRRAIRLQNRRRTKFRFLGLDLRLRRFGHHQRQPAVARWTARIRRRATSSKPMPAVR